MYYSSKLTCYPYVHTYVSKQQVICYVTVIIIVSKAMYVLLILYLLIMYFICINFIYYIKLKSHLFVGPSICLHCWHTHNSAASASIEIGLALNKSCVIEDCGVYFYKPTEPIVYPQECVKSESVSSYN